MQRFALFLTVCTAAIFSATLAAQDVPAPAEAPAAAAPAPVVAPVSAPAPAAEIEVEAEIPPAQVNPQLTLMMMIEQGGAILWVIMGMGFISLVWALYLLLTMTPGREVPKKLAKRAHAQVSAGDIRGAYQMCLEREELLARVLAAGLKLAGHDRFVIQEAMESEGSRKAAELWQRISLLNHVGTLAPLLGLLGTVWGMMQAFVAIAADMAQVQAIGMAAGVSKAMITTAGGLLLAIPCLAIHYYLRGRVVKIISAVEAQANEFIDLIVDNAPKS
jgi:biopolymer transport protein ExbB